MDNQIIQKLDESRPCGIAGRGVDSYYEQDGKLFHMNTKEYYCPVTAPVPAQAQAPAPAPVAPPPKIKCRFCGAERDSLDLMKEHLLAVHRDEVPELQGKPEDTGPSEATEAGFDPEATIPKLREFAERHKIDVSKLTLKADIVEAIQAAVNEPDVS